MGRTGDDRPLSVLQRHRGLHRDLRVFHRLDGRACGRVARDEQGRFVLRYRPWLVLPSRTLTLPAGQYAIGRDWFYPELLLIDGKTRKTICTFSPRYHTHEEALSQIYGLGEIHD